MKTAPTKVIVLILTSETKQISRPTKPGEHYRSTGEEGIRETTRRSSTTGTLIELKDQRDQDDQDDDDMMGSGKIVPDLAKLWRKIVSS